MKIVILDAYNARVEVLSVSDNILARYNDDVEKFLLEHDYSMNCIEWFAVPAKEIPCKYHRYTENANGDEFHREDEGTLWDAFVSEKTINKKVNLIKRKEQDYLRDCLSKYGTPTEDGGFKYEWDKDMANGEKPVCAAYLFDVPTDVIVQSVTMDKYGCLTAEVEDNMATDNCDIEHDVDEFFAGHLTYVTEEIKLIGSIRNNN